MWAVQVDCLFLITIYDLYFLDTMLHVTGYRLQIGEMYSTWDHLPIYAFLIQPQNCPWMSETSLYLNLTCFFSPDLPSFYDFLGYTVFSFWRRRLSLVMYYLWCNYQYGLCSEQQIKNGTRAEIWTLVHRVGSDRSAIFAIRLFI